MLVLLDQPNNASPYNGEASRCWVDCEKIMNERKRPDMSVQETEELKDKCFAPFKAKAIENAKRNDLSKYVKWFPQLAPENPQINELYEQQKNDFEELQASFAAMSTKKKVKTETETKSEEETKTKTKSARWSKYQKK
jgi:hypothetical protein